MAFAGAAVFGRPAPRPDAETPALCAREYSPLRTLRRARDLWKMRITRNSNLRVVGGEKNFLFPRQTRREISRPVPCEIGIFADGIAGAEAPVAEPVVKRCMPRAGSG